MLLRICRISIAILSVLVSISTVIWPRSFIACAYKAIGHYLPDAVILGAAGAAHLIRRIPRFAGKLPLGHGPQGGIEWVLNVGSSEQGFFWYAGWGASFPPGANLVLYAALVWRLYNLGGHYAGPAASVIGGNKIQGGFFLGGTSPIGSYWGLVIGRRILGNGTGVSGGVNLAFPLSVRSYRTMWPMFGFTAGLGALIGGYLGRRGNPLVGSILGATILSIWPFTKWLEGPDLWNRQAWR